MSDLIRDFRHGVVRPCLMDMAMHSPEAEELLMGTAVHESRGLAVLTQDGGGPALSFFQIEPATADWIVTEYLARKEDRADAFKAAVWVTGSHLIDWRAVDRRAIEIKLLGDMRFACAIARLRYRMVPAALPGLDDPRGQARYWKCHYNTAAGAGRQADYIDSYRQHGVRETR